MKLKRLTAFALLLALFISGCTRRPEPLDLSSSDLGNPPTSDMAPEPTPEPSPTPCPHSWENGQCSWCGISCSHTWKRGICETCGLECFHPSHDTEGICTVCGKRVPHEFVKSICRVCGAEPVFETEDVPSGMFEPCPEAGIVETLEYTTHNYMAEYWHVGYFEIEKSMQVYLPYGYDPNEKYDVLFLLHGSGDRKTYWLGEDHEYGVGSEIFVRTTDFLDNMIYNGLCRKLIVVAPSYYRNDDDHNDYDRPYDYPQFVQEIQKDILPLLAEHYSLWNEGTDPEDFIAIRDHLGIAGFSMGSVVIWSDILVNCPELFSWYGGFSASDGYMDTLSRSLDAKAKQGYPIRYFYNCIGTRDKYYTHLHPGQYNQLVSACSSLTDNVNASLTWVTDARHEYRSWIVGVYNALPLFFTPDFDSVTDKT